MLIMSKKSTIDASSINNVSIYFNACQFEALSNDIMYTLSVYKRLYPIEF